LGYAIIGIALLLFVQANNVFPQLLLVRIIFSIGAAATSTMVTAILPSIIAASTKHDEADAIATQPPLSNGHETAPSITSDLTITPHRIENRFDQQSSSKESSPTRLAGIVGLFTGCGALLALGLFLRLPELIQRTGVEAGQALMDSYYIVGALSLTLCFICYVGLWGLTGEDGKSWQALVHRGAGEKNSGAPRGFSSFESLLQSIQLGFQSPLLGLAYIGGFVARASSVGISLFIPLFVNAYYISSGRCDETGRDPQEMKERCRGAYVLAAELTGVSQLVALIFAPIFGYLADRHRQFNAPLHSAALVGILGYLGLATLNSPEPNGQEGSLWVFVIMALLGISQIGAIVCSLGLLGRCVLGLDVETDLVKSNSTEASPNVQSHSTFNSDLASTLDHQPVEINEDTAEETPLLPSKSRSRDHLKGSIAGVYSLTGGVGILILTKLGGLMFDKVSVVAPFYMLAIFNGLLFLIGMVLEISRILRRK